MLGGGKAVPKPKGEERSDGTGFYDRRYDVHFPEGFEIFQTYFGKEYRARATGGTWLLLNNGKRYGSLNGLSQSIGTKTENAWVSWLFTARDGQPKPVSDLRDPSKIHRRKPRLTVDHPDPYSR